VATIAADTKAEVRDLAQFLSAAPCPPLVLTGAGMSTDSGIPDYRGPSGATRKYAPMTYQAFTGDPAGRHRYWARSYVGWRQIADARPNAGHRAVAQLQSTQALGALITQNVDGLHQAAGSPEVIELHGGLDRVVCLACGGHEARTDIDVRLRAANPGFGDQLGVANPDGDAEIGNDDLAAFVMVGCAWCGSDLVKPDVVFFGENVPRDRVQRCFDLVDVAGALVVLGSSLTVMSGYRFVRRAGSLGVPIAIVNQGATRGDDLADLRVDAALGAVLPALAESFSTTVSG
jgi:NAD-dependent SIR2 family protein deacetylase